jgi:hypothetical protein
MLLSRRIEPVRDNNSKKQEAIMVLTRGGRVRYLICALYFCICNRLGVYSKRSGGICIASRNT